MPENYDMGMEEEQAAPGMPPDSGDPGEPGEGGEDESTAILPKSILMGKEFEPGDELVLRIVRMHENEIEVTYASEETGEEEGPEEEMGPPVPTDEMGEMMG